MPFQDRHDAGRQLAILLSRYAEREKSIVLGLPRGGIPVAYEIARALRLPLDVFLVRKLGVPGHEELAMGAIATGGVKVLNRDVVEALHISPAVIDAVLVREQYELERRERDYRGGKPPLETSDRTVILVDDGLATGATMTAAVTALCGSGARKIIVAAPVASKRTCMQFRYVADDIICAETPDDFTAVGEWYEDFSQTTDQEVRELLARAASEQPVETGGL